MEISDSESCASLSADEFVTDQLKRSLADSSATRGCSTESKESQCMPGEGAEAQTSTPPQLPALEMASTRRELRAVAVEVPPLPDDESEYEFLPGHSTVRNILDKKHTADGVLYYVHLESDDKEWVSQLWSIE